MDLNSIPVDMVESVTVFKPPVPVWLGPGGSDGAINIITREIKQNKRVKKANTTIKAAGGSFGQAQAGISQVVNWETAIYCCQPITTIATETCQQRQE